MTENHEQRIWRKVLELAGEEIARAAHEDAGVPLDEIDPYAPLEQGDEEFIRDLARTWKHRNTLFTSEFEHVENGMQDYIDLVEIERERGCMIGPTETPDRTTDLREVVTLLGEYVETAREPDEFSKEQAHAAIRALKERFERLMDEGVWKDALHEARVHDPAVGIYGIEPGNDERLAEYISEVIRSEVRR